MLYSDDAMYVYAFPASIILVNAIASPDPTHAPLEAGMSRKQVRIHESTVARDWAGAVMPENHAGPLFCSF